MIEALEKKITEHLQSGIRGIDYPDRDDWENIIFAGRKASGDFKPVLNVKPLNTFFRPNKHKQNS